MAKKLDLNKASKDDLKQLEGMNDSLADKIIEYRESMGGFESLDDLDDVEGFSEERKQELEAAVEVGGSIEDEKS